MAKAAAVTSDNRLVQLNDELSHILDEKVEFLTRTLNDTQRFTQKIAQTELDIQRHNAQYARLQDECEGPNKELATLAQRSDSSVTERDQKQQSKFEQEKELQRLEWEIEDKRKGVDEATTRIKGLEVELESVSNENEKLQSRVGVLEEGVERMKNVRDEYMAKIQGLDQQMKSLAGGGE